MLILYVSECWSAGVAVVNQLVYDSIAPIKHAAVIKYGIYKEADVVTMWQARFNLQLGLWLY